MNTMDIQYSYFEWHVSKIFELKIKLKSIDFLQEIKRLNIPDTDKMIRSLCTKQDILDNWYIPVLSMSIDWNITTIHDICKILDSLVKMRLWSLINMKICRMDYYILKRYEINSAIYVLSRYNKTQISKVYIANRNRNKPSYTKNKYYSTDKKEVILKKDNIYFDMNSIKELAVNNFCEVCVCNRNEIFDASYYSINISSLICKICYANISDIRLICFPNNRYGHRICKSCYELVSLCPFCREPLEKYHIVHYKTSNLEASMYVIMIIVLYYIMPDGIIIFTIYWWLAIIFLYYKRYFKNLFRIMNLSERKKAEYEKYLAMTETCDL